MSVQKRMREGKELHIEVSFMYIQKCYVSVCIMSPSDNGCLPVRLSHVAKHNSSYHDSRKAGFITLQVPCTL